MVSLPTFAWGSRRRGRQVVRGRKPGDRFVRVVMRPRRAHGGLRGLLDRIFATR